MLEGLTEALSSSSWTYALVLSFAAFDALLPLVPSETAAIAAGVLAAAGGLNIVAVVAAAAAGAFVGDNGAYFVGRTAGRAAVSRLFGAWGGIARLAWAGRVLDERGPSLVLVGRFVPGGRTAVTLTAGLTTMPLRRFVPAAAFAALLWGTFASGLGYLGGNAFEKDPWLGFGLAVALAVAILFGVEVARRLRRPRKRLCGACSA